MPLYYNVRNRILFVRVSIWTLSKYGGNSHSGYFPLSKSEKMSTTCKPYFADVKYAWKKVRLQFIWMNLENWVWKFFDLVHHFIAFLLLRIKLSNLVLPWNGMSIRKRLYASVILKWLYRLLSSLHFSTNSWFKTIRTVCDSLLWPTAIYFVDSQTIKSNWVCSL